MPWGHLFRSLRCLPRSCCITDKLFSVSTGTYNPRDSNSSVFRCFGISIFRHFDTSVCRYFDTPRFDIWIICFFECSALRFFNISLAVPPRTFYVLGLRVHPTFSFRHTRASLPKNRAVSISPIFLSGPTLMSNRLRHGGDTCRPRPLPLRTNRLLKHGCRSDDEMFGEGDGAGEKAANGKANAMEVDDGEDDDKENSSAGPAKVFTICVGKKSTRALVLFLRALAVYHTTASARHEVKRETKRCLRCFEPYEFAYHTAPPLRIQQWLVLVAFLSVAVPCTVCRYVQYRG